MSFIHCSLIPYYVTSLALILVATRATALLEPVARGETVEISRRILPKVIVVDIAEIGRQAPALDGPLTREVIDGLETLQPDLVVELECLLDFARLLGTGAAVGVLLADSDVDEVHDIHVCFAFGNRRRHELWLWL